MGTDNGLNVSKRVKVFISYRHGSKEVTEITEALSELLKKYEFDCKTDMDCLNPEDGWYKWMEDEIKPADYVLIICTKSYKECVEGKVKEKKGVFYEYQLIRNRIQSEGKQDWCIPLIIKQNEFEYVPLILKSATICHIENKEDMEKLFRILMRPTTGTEMGLSQGIYPGSVLNPEEFANELVQKVKRIKEQYPIEPMEISKTEALNTEISKPQYIRRNYISFDLGSETMAACVQHYKSYEIKDIYLQEFALVLLNANEDEIDYLWSVDKSNDKSPWLRNLISIQDKRQDDVLHDSHSTLQFINEEGKPLVIDGNKKAYDLSLFGYFFKKNEALKRKVLPNPKMHFMKGAAQIIPEVESATPHKRPVKHNPEILIHHMITQVLQNFVLKSTALRNKNKCDEYSKVEDHLILSIPNICGLTQAKNIQDFIKNKTGFDEVEIFFESDAASFYLFDRNDNNEQFNKFIAGINASGESVNYQVLTFDIGHGTTDISLIKIFSQREWGEDFDRKKFFVKARTGRTDGGSRLNYILANYYNDCLKEIYNKKKFKTLPLPAFDFINGPGEKEKQGPILESLEKFIKKLKTRINKDYKIQLMKKEQKIYINDIVQKWISANKLDEKSLGKLNKAFAKQFHLKRLPGSQIWRFLYKKNGLLSSKIKRKIELRKDIENYVKENTIDLLANLGNFAIENERKKDPYDREPPKTFEELIKATPTFAIIAGQASQFMPIHDSIEKELKKLKIPVEHIAFLPGEKAKKACLWGSIICKFLHYECENPGDIHGTIGFWNEDPTSKEQLRTIDMKELNEKGKYTIPFTRLSTFNFFYSTRPSYSFAERPPNFSDGTTFLLDQFQQDHNFEVEYDKKKRKLLVNGTPINIISYGGNLNDDETDNSIFKKVWPVALDPATSSWRKR